MYSQCPECLTRFRVTAAALRAARGTVRCGRCGIAFDALPHLSDTLTELTAASAGTDLPAALADTTGHATGPADGTLVTEFHFSADDIEQVFVDARDWQRRFGESGPGTSTDEELAADLAAAGAVEPAESDTEGSAATVRAGDYPAADVFVHEPENVEDITLEGERIVIEGHYDDDETSEGFGDDAERLAPAPDAEIEPDLDSTDQFETLRIRAAAAALMGDDAAAHVPPLPEDEFEKQIERALALSQVAPAAAPSTAAAPATLDVVTPSGPPVAAAVEPVTEQAADAVIRPRPEVAAAEPPRSVEYEELQLGDEGGELPRARGKGLLWGLGALLLALVLAAQLTHHYRRELARDPFVGPPVRAIYAQLGMPLASNWNLGAFELRQWGASDSAPTPDGRLTIRASLRNRAAFAQPMPLLRLELEDRYGSTVARRDFEPREYLKDPAQATRLLAAGATTEAEIAIADAASDAVGYRLDVCLRDEVAAVHCAASEPARAAP